MATRAGASGTPPWAGASISPVWWKALRRRDRRRAAGGRRKTLQFLSAVRTPRWVFLGFHLLDEGRAEDAGGQGHDADPEDADHPTQELSHRGDGRDVAVADGGQGHD